MTSIHESHRCSVRTTCGHSSHGSHSGHRDLRVGTPPLRILLSMQRAVEVGLPTDWHEHRYRRRS